MSFKTTLSGAIVITNIKDRGVAIPHSRFGHLVSITASFTVNKNQKYATCDIVLM